MAKFFIVTKTNSESDLLRGKEQPLLTDYDLTMFPGSVTSPEVTSESTLVITECRYPSQPRRPPARYQEQQTT